MKHDVICQQKQIIPSIIIWFIPKMTASFGLLPMWNKFMKKTYIMKKNYDFATGKILLYHMQMVFISATNPCNINSNIVTRFIFLFKLFICHWIMSFLWECPIYDEITKVYYSCHRCASDRQVDYMLHNVFCLYGRYLSPKHS